jgi:hypothetical protein
VNPEKQGTKVAAHYRVTIAPGQSATVRLRLTSQSTAGTSGKATTPAFGFGAEFDQALATRLQEADEFYRSVTPPSVSPDAANVMRQAIAGMLWSKQFFFFDGDNWLDEHHSNPLHSGYRNARNSEWFHMLNEDIISMPDKWEYPWYAAWDLAFHTLPLSIVDSDFAKQQLELMLQSAYLHPSGQMPAYEWNFSDVNPPVHAFATLFLHRTEHALRGEVDLDFLRSAFKSSTAAPRCPRAATWSRRTARRGWPSSARTCWSSRGNSPPTTPSTRAWSSSSSSISSLSPRP